MSAEQELIFDDLAPKVVPVKIGDRRYLLKEVCGESAAKYRNAEAGVISHNQSTKTTHLDGAGDLFPLLVSLALFEVYEFNGEAKNRPVLKTTVLGWPDRLVLALFKQAEKLNPGLVGSQFRGGAEAEKLNGDMHDAELLKN